MESKIRGEMRLIKYDTIEVSKDLVNRYEKQEGQHEKNV